MKSLLFMENVIEQLSQGKVLRTLFMWFLRILAAALVLIVLVGWIPRWKAVSGMSADAIIGFVLFQLIALAAAALAVHILVIRSRNIKAITDSEYTVIPILSVFFKAIGEVYACFAALLSIGGGLFIWFGGRQAGILRHFGFGIPTIQWGSTGGFLGGLLTIVGGCLAAFLVLMLFYWIAESLILGVDIAHNTRSLRSKH
jgi:hypothetical protein